MPPSIPSTPPKRRIPIVLANAVLQPLATFWRAGAPLINEVFVGVALSGLFAAAAFRAVPLWSIAAVALAGFALRRADLEAWAFFIPGGLFGRVQETHGRPLARAAAAAVFLERVFFVSLAALVAGRYVVAALLVWFPASRTARSFAPDDLTAAVAVFLVGAIWLRSRLGWSTNARIRAQLTWTAGGLIFVLAVWGLVSLLIGPERANVGHVLLNPATSASPWSFRWPWLATVTALIVGFGLALPALGTSESLPRVATDLAQPRVVGLRQLLRLLGVFCMVVIVAMLATSAAVSVAGAGGVWTDAPLFAMARYLIGPAWLVYLMASAAAAAVIVSLGYAVDAGLDDAERTMRGLADRHVLPESIVEVDPRFGTFVRVSNIAVAGIIALILIGGSRLTWLTGGYATVVVIVVAVKVMALMRLRRRKAGPAAIGRTPAIAVIAGVMALTLVVRLTGGDISAWLTLLALAVMAAALWIFDRGEQPSTASVSETFKLVPTAELSLARVSAKPGGVLVAVRHPHSLTHLAAALRTVGDRDIVAMTARLSDPGAEPLDGNDVQPTDAEAELFSHVITLAERYGKNVRLLIVPADDVFEAVVAAVIHLQSSEVLVGESTTLPALTQARLLGGAWERAEKSENLKVRLSIHHTTGRSDTYFLGAHAPTLTPQDVDLIHQLWLDTAKVVGSHVHHHDVVRAALIQMAEQLHGPERDQALEAVRRVARQADELVAVVRSRDFSRLRDMVRNLPPDDLARLLTDLNIEDQVVVFRLLPRKDAAAAFEYLSQEYQEALLKAMAQEDVAALLNEMSPDDRTMLLEELPATVTRQLLALLTPEERSVASRLLGYPENSIGRLMTPNYVAVREDWTIEQVLDYVRKHGQDSETLNVLYVVDDQGLLIDDIRIREVLLTAPETRLSALMDRRFVALKATDDEDTAVSTFRQNHRVALPVTDTAGVLIGIVTIDDVLDVAEEKATQEIQRIGGSEALDEPYMTIGFAKMIKKRAGWLTVLFLGEMLTASAMSWFGDEISKAVVLSFFIPLIISSGGNSGSQASTLVIRAMALGELTLRDWWRVMRREIGAGLALGSILAVIAFLRISIYSQFSPLYGAHWGLIGMTVSMTLVGIVLWGTMIGALLPLVLRRLGFDPATSSAPFVATLVDVTGLVIYFSIATVILHGTLL